MTSLEDIAAYKRWTDEAMIKDLQRIDLGRATVKDCKTARAIFHLKLEEDKDFILALQRACLLGGACIPHYERRRQAHGRKRLKDRLSKVPWYREQAKKCGVSFWRKLHGSCILS